MRHSSPKRSIYTNILILARRGVLVFVFLAGSYLFYVSIVRTVITDAVIIITFLIFWVFMAYVLLPRLHRLLSRLYLPDYYIGRSKTSDGLLGDPINLAINGSRHRLIAHMEAAGWRRADPTTIKTAVQIVLSTLLKRSYPTAPISNLMLFGKKQELAFQKEIDGNPRARHHVRFWSTPKTWLLPGGYRADWLGAATHDVSVGLSLFTGQITHKIDENVDMERDLIVSDLTAGSIKTKYVDHFNTAYHHRAGGGDSIRTDGAMPFIDLR